MRKTNSSLSRRRFLADTLKGAGALLTVGCSLRSGGTAWAQGMQALEPYTETIPGTEVELPMHPIPGGSITMADPYREGAWREVTIEPFWMLSTEVTWDAYSIFAYGHHLSEGVRDFAFGIDAVTRPTDPFVPPGNRGWGEEGEPAIRITYYAAVRFCEWLSEKAQRHYRLPTEAEWEWACRAGAAAGERIDEAALDAAAWHAGNADGRSRPVASKVPNAWGLYDMLGNVAEWCEGLDDKPVVRGGSFKDPVEKLRPERRQYYSAEWQESDYQDPQSRWWLSDAPHVGFRLACQPRNEP